MPYPFCPSVTWAEFIEKLQTLGVEFVDEWVGSTKITYFKHKVDGKLLVHAVVIPDFGEQLMPSVVISACRNLEISPMFFGFTLD